MKPSNRDITKTPDLMGLSSYQCTPSSVVEAILNHYTVSRKALKSNSRKEPIMTARRYICYFLTINRMVSLEQIGRITGRDHATVLWSKKTIEEWFMAHKAIENELLMLAYEIQMTWEMQQKRIRSGALVY